MVSLRYLHFLARPQGGAVACDAAMTAVKSIVPNDKSVVGNKNKHFYNPETINKEILSPLSLEQNFDVVVVGGGIVGVATARELLKRYPKLTVAVIEKEAEVAGHQTGHNSGVIHAGIYYVPGSVMAHTCVRGADLMYKYCEDKKIPVDRVGKLIVASDEKEHIQVVQLFERATKNGVKGLEILNQEGVANIEPNVRAYSALWSPNTGVVDFGLVTRSLAHDVITTGRGDIKLSFQANKFEKDPESGRIVISGVEPGQRGPKKVVTAKYVITCGGLYADRLGVMAGGSPSPKIVPFRGTYYQVKEEYKDICKVNIYPVPSGGGIPVGIHFTPTVNERRGHQMIVGPGACIAFGREGYTMKDISIRDMVDYLFNGGLLAFAIKNPKLSIGELWKDISTAAFVKEATKLVPSFTIDMVEPSFSGVMAQVREAKTMPIGCAVMTASLFS